MSTWSGLRPLVADRRGHPSDVSRRHEIKMGEPGWWDVTGGKLTTYRLMAEQVVDQLVAYLDRRVGPCRTAREALLEPGESDAVSMILPPPVTEEVVQHYCRNEWAVRLEDVMVRRTSWRYYHRDHEGIAERVAGWMADALRWDEVKRQDELGTYGAWLSQS